MLKFKLCLLVLLSAAAAHLHAADTLLAELTGADAATARDYLDRAGQYPPPFYYYRYLGFAFRGVEAKLAYPQTTDRYNPINIVADFNGKLFRFVVEFSSMDNFKEMKFKATDDSNGPAGIYLFQTGFRWNYLRDMVDRVESRTRIADVKGAVLAQLEYHEDTFQAQQPGFDEAYPQYGFNNYKTSFAPGAQLSRRQPMTKSIPEELPGSFHYWEMQRFYQNAPEYGFCLNNYAFQNIKGWVGFGGIPNSAPVEMYANINGHFFSVQFPVQYMDNWNSFKRDSTGYYWIQRGFVQDSAGALQRDIATIRVAAPDGTALPALEYDETLSTAEGSDFKVFPEGGAGDHF